MQVVEFEVTYIYFHRSAMVIGDVINDEARCVIATTLRLRHKSHRVEMKTEIEPVAKRDQ